MTIYDIFFLDIMTTFSPGNDSFLRVMMGGFPLLVTDNPVAKKPTAGTGEDTQ